MMRNIAVSMRYWYLSLCMGGVWSGYNPASRTDATHTEWQIPVSQRYRNFSSDDWHMAPDDGHMDDRNM